MGVRRDDAGLTRCRRHGEFGEVLVVLGQDGLDDFLGTRLPGVRVGGKDDIALLDVLDLLARAVGKQNPRSGKKAVALLCHVRGSVDALLDPLGRLQRLEQRMSVADQAH